MSVVATRVRERSFKMVLGGADPESVRAALDAAANAFEALERDIDRLRQEHAAALSEIDRVGELERSLLRSCVAAEEDARIRCGAARRYATRVIGAAQEQAAARLESPARERDAIARQIDAIAARRRHAAQGLEGLIAGLEHSQEPDQSLETDDDEAGEREGFPLAATVGAISEPADVELAEAIVSGGAPDTLSAVSGALSAEGDRGTVTQAAAREQLRLEPPLRVVESRPSGAGIDAGPGNRDEARVADGPTVARPQHAPSRGRRFRVPVAAGSAAALLLILQGSAVTPRGSGARPVIAAASFAPAPPEAVPEPATPDAARAATDTAPGTTEPAQAPAAALTMRIKPLRTCWVRVVVDDRTDARELQPTEDIVLHAQRSIVLRIGDAGALSVELNGRVLPPLGLDGQVVERRFTAPTAAAAQ